MLQLIPPKKGQVDSMDQLQSNSPSKKQNFFNVGFKANGEDNIERKSKVRQFLTEFQALLETLKAKESGFSFNDKLKENSDMLFEVLDKVFCLYNVNIQTIQQDQSDSAIRIEPIQNIGKALHCLAYIAVILSKFPYSFIKIIELNKFTICKLIHLKKEGHGDFYNARIMTNAMFMTDVHDSYEKVANHFYKVVLYHIQKKLPTVNTEWPIDRSARSPLRQATKTLFSFSNTQLNERSSPIMGTRSRSPSPNDKIEKNKATEEQKAKEQLDVFCKLMNNPRVALDSSNERLQVRAFLLKEKLEELDGVGVCKDWWKDLNDSSIIVIEEAHGFFTLKL